MSSGERLGLCYKFPSHQNTDVLKAITLTKVMKEKIKNPSRD